MFLDDSDEMTSTYLKRMPTMSPKVFYGIADLAMSMPDEEWLALDAITTRHTRALVELEAEAGALSTINNRLLSEVRQTTRRARNPFRVDEAEDDLTDLQHTAGETFMKVIFDVTYLLRGGYLKLVEPLALLRPAPFLLFGDRIEGMPRSMKQLQAFASELSLNLDNANRFVRGVELAERARDVVVQVGRKVIDRLDRYHVTLQHRHTVEGVPVFDDPVTTDVALSIYENVDANGEIADGKKPDEVSAYSVRKASLLADAILKGVVGDLVRSPDKLLALVKRHLVDLWSTAIVIAGGIERAASELHVLLGTERPCALLGDAAFNEALTLLEDLDPRNVTFKDKAGLLTAEERFEREFRDETLHGIVKRLKSNKRPVYGQAGAVGAERGASLGSTKELIDYVLRRKDELRTYHQDVNSFYVCNVSAGNPFLGEAPGALKVVPGVKPDVAIADVVGSGFDDVRAFIDEVRSSARWHDLFLATSPSKSADKANCLLVGPMGCGKSEVLRAVGGDKRSIGIYAQPSDFLTCWKGEAEKNPKRLFEAALRIQKESRRQVFILIDEVDTILNDDHARGGFGATNLTTEFQQLMDGIMQYPHIAVWAATNHPERIPMPMIRRFSKVAIVGELDQAARVRLLKQFVGFLPTSDRLREEHWEDAAKRLEGAVGDTVRKVADHVWRTKMGAFVRAHEERAEELVATLNEGERFQLARFDADKRVKFHDVLRPHVAVEPEDLLQSVDIHLSNVAVRAEIDTAVMTYAHASELLLQLQSRRGEEPVS